MKNTCANGERRANNDSNPGIVNINKEHQDYELYPSPNDGHFELRQMVADKEPITAEVFDITGRSVGKEKVTFDAAITKLHVGNVASGVYLLQITDARKRIFKIKFVIAR